MIVMQSRAYFKRIWKLWGRRFLRAISKSTRFPILELPLDLLYAITDFLPETSKLCLALTCKQLLGAIDGSKSLRQSVLFQLLQSVPDAFERRPGAFCSERAQFLCLLGRDAAPAWVFCEGCLKLHPSNKFHGFDSDCQMGVFEGFIRICPCWRFTSRDTHNLIQTLQHTTGDVRQVLHECTYQYSDAEVRLKITAGLNGCNPARLALDTEYNVSGGCLPYSLIAVPQVVCAHRTVYNYLVQSRREPDRYRKPITCRSCYASAVALQCDGDDPTHSFRQCTFQIRRVFAEGRFFGVF